MDIKIKIYEGGTKYQACSSVDRSVDYHGVQGFEVVTDPMSVEQIEATGLVDAHHEYLVLDLGNGETATFRNSQVDMFRI